MFKYPLLFILLVLLVVTSGAVRAQSINPIYPQFCTVACGSLILSSASGSNFYGMQVTASSTAGYAMLFDSTTAPVDGTVTPVKCVAVTAGGSSFLSLDPTAPWTSKNGWVLVFSTTGCFTKTISATAFLSGQSQ